MKVEKRKDGGFVLRAETGKNTPEEEFIDFLGNICNKIKKNLKTCVWVVEYHNGTGYVPDTISFRTRKEARDEAREEALRPCRVRKYARI